MPTPPKPAEVLKFEKKSHRTKAELEQRQKAEDALLTGKHMRVWPEVKADDVAKKEFNRVKGLLKIIGKDDALHEGPVNRYAMLRSECIKLEERKNRLQSDIEDAVEARESREIEFLEYMGLVQKITANIIAVDKQIQTKRRMLLDIEKENIMTIAAALRSIPKKVKSEEEQDPMAELLKRRG